MGQEKARLGIVGVGGMGSKHVSHILDLPNTELAAVCDSNPARLQALDIPPAIPQFQEYERMLADVPAMQGVIIATPHYDHPDMSLAALDRGIPVLVEKPIAAHVREAQRLVAGYQRAKEKREHLVFSAMFMQRTWGHWQAIKSMIDGGALGKLMRCTWIITDWFRAQSYYDSGDWRATWAGEGGGVLMNQCPHNLDLLQWFLGMPQRVRGFVSFGKHHQIEVEDEVTAYLEYDNGMVAHFITTTGESPGTNRLEIVGEHGKLVYDASLSALAEPDPVSADAAQKPSADASSNLVFYRNAWSSIKQIRESQAGFDKVPCHAEAVAYPPRGSHGHELIIANFADAILTGAEVIAPASEGLNSVMLNNAIILSAHKRQAVSLPIDADEYADLIAQYIAKPPSARARR